MEDEDVGPGNGGKKKKQFIDRSKVRILLCDNDVNGCHEVFCLLSNCFYQGQVVAFPRKSELKIGECSAFFTYVKSNTVNNNCQSGTDVDENTTSNSNFQEVEIVHIKDNNTSQPSRVEDKLQTRYGHASNEDVRYEIKDPWKNSSLGDELPGSTSVLDSTSLERSCTPSVSTGFIPNSSSDEGLSQAHIQQRNSSHFDVSGFAEHHMHPFYMSGYMNHVMMPSIPMYQRDVQGDGASYMMPHYNHFPHCPPHMPSMTPFPYYPMGMCVQQGQLPANQQPPSYGNSPSSEAGLSKVDRREAALSKFRQKRERRSCREKTSNSWAVCSESEWRGRGS